MDAEPELLLEVPPAWEVRARLAKLDAERRLARRLLSLAEARERAEVKLSERFRELAGDAR